MPPRTYPFQRLVTLLTATLGDRAKVTESAMLTDRVTGEQREVDVLIIATSATYQVRMGIEVVAWGRPADVTWIEKMRAKHENLATDKLILVSQSGFSGPAMRKAEFYGIEALTIDEACEADWPLIAKLEETGVFEVTTMKFDVNAVCRLADGSQELRAVPLSSSFPTPAGTTTIDAFVRALLDRDEVRETLRANLAGSHEHDFSLSYTEPKGLWKFENDGKAGQIIELRIGLKVLHTSSPVRFGSGKFRATPFVSGTSSASTEPLQFVLAKRPDGSATGYLIDRAGIRTLSAKPG